MYSIIIHGVNYSHTLFTMPTKKVAEKEYSYILRNGSIWCDDLDRNERAYAIIQLLQDGEVLREGSFTKKYINRGAK